MCEMGERMCNAFDEVIEVIDQLNYYLFPRPIQRMLPTVMLYARQPVSIQGYGNILCVREVFKNVLTPI